MPVIGFTTVTPRFSAAEPARSGHPKSILYGLERAASTRDAGMPPTLSLQGFSRAISDGFGLDLQTLLQRSGMILFLGGESRAG